MPTIAFVTTCKGRLHHVRQTLPRLMAENASETIVVDYGCPDKVGDWVSKHHPAAKVVRVADDPEFCSARARNLGGLAAQSDWLVFIDGDVLIQPGWVAWMRDRLEPGRFYRAAPVRGKRDPETYGTVACLRADFEAIGGYDEAFRGWGGDDEDFYRRLLRSGLEEGEYPHEFVEAISHGDDERAGWSGMQSRDHTQAVHECYMAAKAKIEQAMGGSHMMPLDARKRLLANTAETLRDWFAKGSPKPLKLRFVVDREDGGWMPPPLEFRTELSVEVHVRDRLIHKEA